MMPLSLTGKVWEIATDCGPEETDALSLLTSQRSMDPLERFPLPFSTPDSTPPDLERAIERVQHAVRDGETIAIFGDYDCDGITAATLITRLLRRHGADPLVRLPHRITHRYGLKERVVQDFASQGVSLLLTVDTGISASVALALAAERGMDVIVIDHHHLPPSLPVAAALGAPSASVAGSLRVPSAELTNSLPVAGSLRVPSASVAGTLRVPSAEHPATLRVPSTSGRQTGSESQPGSVF